MLQDASPGDRQVQANSATPSCALWQSKSDPKKHEACPKVDNWSQGNCLNQIRAKQSWKKVRRVRQLAIRTPWTDQGVMPTDEPWLPGRGIGLARWTMEPTHPPRTEDCNTRADMGCMPLDYPPAFMQELCLWAWYEGRVRIPLRSGEAMISNKPVAGHCVTQVAFPQSLPMPSSEPHCINKQPIYTTCHAVCISRLVYLYIHVHISIDPALQSCVSGIRDSAFITALITITHTSPTNISASSCNTISFYCHTSTPSAG